MLKTLGFKMLIEASGPASAFARADKDEVRKTATGHSCKPLGFMLRNKRRYQKIL